MESVANSEQLRTVALIVAEYLEAGREMSAAVAALHAGDDLDFDAIEQRHAAAEDALTRLDPVTLRDAVSRQVRESGIWQGRMNMACLRLDRHAEGMAAIGNDGAARAYRKAADIVGEEYHAALCDLAGGEG